MLETSRKEIQKFANLLRKKLLDDGCDQKYLNSMSDHNILEEFRMCCDCGVEIHTHDQQLRLILESDSSERAFEFLYGSLSELHDKDYDQVYKEDCEDCEDYEDYDYEDYEEEDEEEEDEEELGCDCPDCCEEENDELTVRGKWIFDGSETIDDMVNCLEVFIEDLKNLKGEGYELMDTIIDDYGFLGRN